jgi:cell division protein FtsA
MSNNQNTNIHQKDMASKNDIIVGLDIGTTKICAIVGQLAENGKINVLGMGKAASAGGVSRGMVANIRKAEMAIREAVEEAQRQSQVAIKNVFVGIAGHHIRSMQHRGTLSRRNSFEEIKQEELDKLEQEMQYLALEPGVEILHVLPQDYRIDDEDGVKDPVGRMGVRVECNYHIITGQTAAARHIFEAVKRAGLEVADLIVEPYASASAVLSQAEMDAGVALVDIGGGTTDICVFEDGSIRHTAIISIGGDRITKDLKEAFGILPEQAEIVKVNYGSCYPTESMKNEVVVVPGLPGRKSKEISRFAIAQVIQARMEDIIERINYEIEISTMKTRLAGGIVLTGGGSSLANITQLVSYHTALEVHIGTPGQRLGKGMVDEVRNPMFATGIGLVLRGFETSARFDVPENMPLQHEPSKTVNETPEVVAEVPKQSDINKGEGFFKRTWSGNFGGKIMDDLKNWMKDGQDFTNES